MRELKISLDIYIEMPDGITKDLAVDMITDLLEKQKGVDYQIYETEEQEA